MTYGNLKSEVDNTPVLSMFQNITNNINGDDFMQITVPLTDAQIKHLPTLAIDIVPAPGLGKMLVFIRGVIHSIFTVPYSNVDEFGGIGFDNVAINLSDLLTTQREILLGTSGATYPDSVFQLFPHYNPSATVVYDTSTYENRPIRFFASQDDTGLDYEDGDPTNTMEVTVFYVIVDL